MATPYGGFYSKQEQEDVQTTQITNPNRVGSGFINLGPQQRYAAPQQAANWQTASAVGVAPQQVAQIWDAPAAPPKAPPLPPQRPAPQAFAGQQGGGAFPGRGPPATQGGVNELFNSFGIDPNQQARAAAQAAAKAPPFVPPANMTMPPAPASVQQPYMNGGGGPAPQPGPSLMSMLGGGTNSHVPPTPPQGLNPQFANLGNGNANRMHGAGPFATMPPVNAMPPQPPYSNNYHPGGGGGGNNQMGNNHNNYRAQAPPPPPAPKTLASAADYAAAAQQYKPPAAAVRASGAAISVSRKAESQSAASASRESAPRATEQREEWECSRCTFLNNGSLWECEMCGAERPGKTEHQTAAVAREVPRSAPASASEGWQTASKDRKAPSHSAAANAAATGGKSKAQNKNEKRRAKKRDD